MTGRSAAVTVSGRQVVEHRDSGGRHEQLGLDLAAHRLDRLGRGTDPDEAGLDHGPGEGRVLGQESVARVHGIGAGPPGRVDEQVGAQVGVGGRVAGQPDGRVGLADVRGVGVRIGVDRDRPDPEVAAGPEDAAGDLAAVGHQDSGDHSRNTP